jgi:hypothetical protein
LIDDANVRACGAMGCVAVSKLDFFKRKSFAEEKPSTAKKEVKKNDCKHPF